MPPFTYGRTHSSGTRRYGRRLLLLGPDGCPDAAGYLRSAWLRERPGDRTEVQGLAKGERAGTRCARGGTLRPPLLAVAPGQDGLAWLSLFDCMHVPRSDDHSIAQSYNGGGRRRDGALA